MYVLIAGGGKVGSNLARTLIRAGHEVTVIEQPGRRFAKLEGELEHQVHKGDATELFTLERAGIERPPDIVVAVTGDDEDNVVICQLARDRYGVPNVIARVNDPRNQPYFDLLGIAPTVSATAAFVGLIGVVSASTSEMADRFALVRGVLPQGFPTAARVLTLAFGLALLWLSRGLARRKRRAWQLAVVLVVGSAVTHLAKGLDFEEAFGSLVVLAILVRARRQFVAPGDPESVRPLVQVVLGIAALAT